MWCRRNKLLLSEGCYDTHLLAAGLTGCLISVALVTFNVSGPATATSTAAHVLRNNKFFIPRFCTAGMLQCTYVSPSAAADKLHRLPALLCVPPFIPQGEWPDRWQAALEGLATGTLSEEAAAEALGDLQVGAKGGEAQV
jgi:hypothetical protein